MHASNRRRRLLASRKRQGILGSSTAAFTRGDTDKIKLDGVNGAPDLVVEVLSPSTAKNDKGHKKDIYAKYGVKEYWIVSPLDKSVDVYVLEGSSYILHDVYTFYSESELSIMTEQERAP